jgi:hypothetical protein
MNVYGSRVGGQINRFDVSAWGYVRTETVGSSAAVWITDPAGAGSAADRWLFKPVEVHANGTIQGGDWAEKAVQEIARVLGIPTADIELAERDGVRGSISRNVIPELWDMWMGSLWLDADPAVAYSSAVNTSSKRAGPATGGYSLDNIHRALVEVGPPPGFDEVADLSGFDVFCHYLFLDALVANRDRHEDNWGVMTPTIAPSRAALGPAFDNAGSLGYQLTDTKRGTMLGTDGAMERWVGRGSAWRFDVTPTRSLVELAAEAANMVGVAADFPLLDRLDVLTPDFVGSVINAIPGMSEVSRRFACEVIMINVGRIRDGYRNVAA